MGIWKTMFWVMYMSRWDYDTEEGDLRSISCHHEQPRASNGGNGKWMANAMYTITYALKRVIYKFNNAQQHMTA